MILSMPATRRVVVVEAAARGAGAEGEHPLGLGHLLVDALQDRAPGAGVIVPTTHSRSAWRGEKRGASAPKRAMS